MIVLKHVGHNEETLLSFFFLPTNYYWEMKGKWNELGGKEQKIDILENDCAHDSAFYILTILVEQV